MVPALRVLNDCFVRCFSPPRRERERERERERAEADDVIATSFAFTSKTVSSNYSPGFEFLPFLVHTPNIHLEFFFFLLYTPIISLGIHFLRIHTIHTLLRPFSFLTYTHRGLFFDHTLFLRIPTGGFDIIIILSQPPPPLQPRNPDHRSETSTTEKK